MFQLAPHQVDSRRTLSNHITSEKESHNKSVDCCMCAECVHWSNSGQLQGRKDPLQLAAGLCMNEVSQDGCEDSELMQGHAAFSQLLLEEALDECRRPGLHQRRL